MAMLSLKMFLLLILIFFTAESQDPCKERLIGPIIDKYADDTYDTTALEITFSNPILGKRSVNCGNYISFFLTLNMPTIKYDVQGRCVNTTVIFIGIPTEFYDTDTIVGFPYKHMIFHNIPADVLKTGWNGSAGDARTRFFPPINPFSDHYYTFFVYCQDHYVVVKKKENILTYLLGILLDRPSFQIKKYASENGLTPVAINYLVSSVANDFALPPALHNRVRTNSDDNKN